MSNAMHSIDMYRLAAQKLAQTELHILDFNVEFFVTKRRQNFIQDFNVECIIHS